MNVSGPAMPSGVRLFYFFVCHSFNAFSVFEPNSPSVSTPNLACSRLTGSPDVPFLRIAMMSCGLALRPCGLCELGRFLLGREPPLRRQMIDHAREMLTQSGKQLIALHTCLLHEIFDPVLTESGL